MRQGRVHFRICRFRRVYDREQDRFTFNVSYETHTKPTPRSIVVAEAFGLGIDEVERFPVLDAELTIKPTDIIYVTGDSGSGKSVLLRAIRQDLGDEAIDISEVEVDVDKPLIETVGEFVEEGLELLSKVGLNDAFLFLRSYSQLSDGQKYRYRIAKLIESGKGWWLMDEFAATLDRDTAKIVAFNLQKFARQTGKSGDCSNYSQRFICSRRRRSFMSSRNNRKWKGFFGFLSLKLNVEKLNVVCPLDFL
jgi:ABC-type ATPase with predicted acetyltransferase domain